MTLTLTKNEMWKILDAINAYQKDYAVSVAVQKTFNNIKDKLQEELDSDDQCCNLNFTVKALVQFLLTVLKTFVFVVV